MAYTARVPRPPRLFPQFCAFALLAVTLTGCGVVGGESSTATPTATSSPTYTRTPTRTATPTPTDTPAPEPTATSTPVPPPPSAQQQPPSATGDTLPQGQTTVIRVPRGIANGATAIYRGREHRMLPDGDAFWTVIGAGATQETGAYTIVINMLDERGALIEEVRRSITITPTGWPVEYITLPPGQIEGIPAEEVQKEINTRAAVFAGWTPEKLWSGPFILPSNGPVTASFGDARSYNGGPVGSHHSGTDFGAPEGAPVAASARGRVAYVGYLATRGNSIIIDHGVGVFTGYHHLSRIDVVHGQEVAQGQVIGGVGATGLATGPHLHWELIVGGINVSPVWWTYQGVAP